MADRLSLDQALGFDEEITAAGGNCKVTFQSDGNLVLYRLIPPDQGGKWDAVWQSKTVGTGASCTFQPDGNLVVYDAANKARWASNTPNTGAAFAAIQDDENFVIYRNDGTACWDSHTSNAAPYAPPTCSELKAQLAVEKQTLEYLKDNPEPNSPGWKAAVSDANRRIRGLDSLIRIKC